MMGYYIPQAEAIRKGGLDPEVMVSVSIVGEGLSTGRAPRGHPFNSLPEPHEAASSYGSQCTRDTVSS